MFYRRFNLTLTSSTYQQYQQTHLQPQQYVGVMLNAPTALDTAVVKTAAFVVGCAIQGALLRALVSVARRAVGNWEARCAQYVLRAEQ